MSIAEAKRDIGDAQPFKTQEDTIAQAGDCDPTGDCATDCGCGSECGEGACAASCGCECGN